ncbi:MAG: DMT family transporter [Chitinophagaceae bacterium]
MTPQRISLSGFIFTLLGAVLFSTKAIIVKIAFRDTPVDAVTLLTLRMAFSLPFFLGLAFFASGSKDNTTLSPKRLSQIFVIGLFGYYLSSLFDFIGLQYISAGLERLILFLYPTFTVLINAVIFKQKISRVQLLALVLTYLGIGMAYIGELRLDVHNPNFFLGSFLIFACAITYAIYIVGSGRLVPVVGAAKFTAYAMLSSTVGVFLHAFLSGNVHVLDSGQSLWAYGIALAIFATVIPALLISNGMKRIGANNVAIISGVGPVSTIVQAHFVLGEPIFFVQIAGTVLVVAGVLLIGWKK